ncbi:hypothetical protein SaSA201_1794 [Streptococcus agalactiae]|nr:hypothetical protein SaSA20_1740 [Streptococcus agalactiae]EJZ02587.1 MarC membrane protein [Streptococcus agalactiae STIR-CD-17]EPU04168.1 membrane protein [Streptococcus agalactiae STIR-CD-09]EPU06055.1 membrane protein [Streptococcus agalactiae STIR-CD-13]EPW80914.1 membrane protein [Streptococcus agalactiae STIR-CD-07]
MISKFILAFMAFFAIMNPISNLPAFMALVADDDQKISRRIAAKGVLLAFAILCVIMYVILISANEITKFLGKNAMTIITKMMGLILMTIGIEMLITGIKIGFHLT